MTILIMINRSDLHVSGSTHLMELPWLVMKYPMNEEFNILSRISILGEHAYYVRSKSLITRKLYIYIYYHFDNYILKMKTP